MFHTTTDIPSPHPVGVPFNSRAWRPRSGNTPGTPAPAPVSPGGAKDSADSIYSDMDRE